MFLALKCRYLCKLNAHKVLRTVYSGPYTIEDFTKECKEDTSWEAKKLRNLRQRVIDKAEGVTFNGLERIVDEEERKAFLLPHFVFKGKPINQVKDDKLELVMGQATANDNIDKDICSKATNIDPDFERKEVRELLKRLRGKDLEKVYRKIKGKQKEMPSIRLLTNEQLQQEHEAARKRAEELLESPPVMNERSPIDEEIAMDEELDGYEHCNIVFTDISENLNPNDRFIVVREPNGKLRKASWDERERCLQVFFPKPGRHLAKPLMFQDLEIAFKNRIHENVLEQILIHYEPDSKEYIDLTARVYDDVDKNKLFDLLRSTRFFEGFVFHLAKHRFIDRLLTYYINNHLISDAGDLISLFTMLKPQSLTASNIEANTEVMHKIKVYVSNDAVEANVMQQALTSYEGQFAQQATA